MSLIQAAHSKADMLLASACEGPDPMEWVRSLQDAMHVLKDTNVWPITRQPAIAIRDELVRVLLIAKCYKDAFIQAAIRYRRVDPVIFQYEIHPLRQLHAWVLARIAILVAQEAESSPSDSTFLQDTKLTISFITWSVLSELISQQKKSCVSPTFKATVRLAYSEVNGTFLSHGCNPSNMKTRIDAEWAKVEMLIDKVLQEE